MSDETKPKTVAARGDPGGRDRAPEGRGLPHMSGRSRPPTEVEVEQHPDALAGRALLEERLKRLSPEDVRAFREAVRRCYASAKQDETNGAG